MAMSKNKSIFISTSKRGFAAMWESGGGMTSGGSATIIAKRDGSAPRAIYVKRGGHLSCGEHALVGVHEGFYIVNASVKRGSRSGATIQRIVKTTVNDIDGERFEATAKVELINSFSNGEWDKVLDEKFVPAVDAAFRKAGAYHCRSAVFIDTSERKSHSDVEKQRRNEAAAKQDAERAKLRQAKADREAREKAKREVDSRIAKSSGLFVRLEAANKQLKGIKYQSQIEIGESYFKFGWQEQLFTEENVSSVERQVVQLVEQAAEKEHQRQVREVFQPQFEALAERCSVVGLNLYFGESEVNWGGYYDKAPYSDEGVEKFTSILETKEKKAEEARVQAEKETHEKTLVENGAPSEFTCEHERGHGKTHRQCWVIQANGKEREADREEYARHKHVATVWNVIYPTEIALMWEKHSAASEHNFTVVHMETENLTDEQVETLCSILEGVEQQWENARGLASGTPSPDVGKGWVHPHTDESLTKGFKTSRQTRELGEISHEQPDFEKTEISTPQPASTDALAALSNHFNN